MPPLDQKGKNAIAVAGVVLLGAAAYWYYMWSPQQKIVVTTAAHADTLDSLNAKVKREVTKSSGRAPRCLSTYAGRKV